MLVTELNLATEDGLLGLWGQKPDIARLLFGAKSGQSTFAL